MKMTLCMLATFFILASWSSCACAAQWELYGLTGSEGDHISESYDKDSMQWSTDSVKVWVLEMHEQVIQTPVPWCYGQSYQTAKVHYVLNCTSLQMGAESAVYYRADGGIACSWNAPAAPTMSDIVPETIGESLLKKICSQKPKKPDKSGHKKHAPKIVTF
ncbi:surface-adhesin E family protein [Chromobacterium alticapitis]|uniref:surface-adhesin E family protein n=1 Tax=Chromobacterium alticapitis TaxID=2073169 RepID=UPI0011B06C68|nr:surface-adhesin E family protein [Chromobacterium alticapitis]